MPLFQIDIEKRLGTEFWTNVYLIDAIDLVVASSQALELVDVERAFHLNVVEFTKARASVPGQETDLFNTVPLGQLGLRGAGSDLLPLFCTMRVDFQVFGRRPLRKFYRGVLTEFDVAGSQISNPDLISAVSSAFAPTEGVIVNDSLQPAGPPIVVIPVQMRQLRRGKRKRTQPVLPA